MKDDLNRHLDGEIPLEGLGEGSLGEAEAWDRLLNAFRAESPRREAPPWLETRVMAEIEALPEPGVLNRFVTWLVNPRQVRLSPLMVGATMAAMATVLFLGLRESAPGGSVLGPGEELAIPAGLGAEKSESVVLVQFVLEAPGAISVAVAGDFDGWEGSHGLSDTDGDGVWTGRVPVKPGVHAYMFLVDGSTWMTDPRADRYAEDGFGNQNAVLAVTAPSV